MIAVKIEEGDTSLLEHQLLIDLIPMRIQGQEGIRAVILQPDIFPIIDIPGDRPDDVLFNPAS